LSKNLQDDKDVVMAALEQDHDAMEYASDNLKKNKEFALQALE